MADARWKWLLLGLCALWAVWIAAWAADNVGIGERAWYGWWDTTYAFGTHPYSIVFGQPHSGGAAARADIRNGDYMDFREQNLDGRMRAQPLATQPMTIVVHRGAQKLALRLTGSTMWEAGSRVKIANVALSLLASAWFLGCAFLIALRRANLREGRLLSLALLGLAAPGPVDSAMVLPNLPASVILTICARACPIVAMLPLVALSSPFGIRTPWRRLLEGATYLSILGCIALFAAAEFGQITLLIDPAAPLLEKLTQPLTLISALLLAATAGVAVALTSTALRARAAWLFLPLPIAIAITAAVEYHRASSELAWSRYELLVGFGYLIMLSAAALVTYALLRRRALDFEFVLGRTLVFTIVTLLVISSFVLLEWILGTVLVSHATGLIANAALALVIGVSLGYIHKAVDSFVDATLFRKQYEDERALRDFSQEAGYVTTSEALLDAAIAQVRRHTDAGNAAILLDGRGSYATVRAFGNGVPPAVDENDAAIVALKAWRKPLDPHRYETTLQGALAVPMLARGRMVGVVLLGERHGGEAYVRDEVDALSQMAQGVASALDAIEVRKSDGDLSARLDRIERTLVQVAEAVKPPQ